MDNIGVEVGQKMRSAIKAKLMELGCYVDDELPDYIMVMVANKRTKSQMNEDLQLFLTTKTSIFVDWLQVVLKKLKEITVTNPDVYKKVSKRKSDDFIKTDMKVKKEKKDKIKPIKKIKKKNVKPIIQDIQQIKSLTDDLPVKASRLSEMRKIVVMQENQNNSNNLSIENVYEDTFDIPPLSEVAISNEEELEEIKEKMKSVGSKQSLLIPNESEDEDFINIKAEPEDLFPNEQISSEHKQKLNEDNNSRKIRLIRFSDSTTSDKTSSNIYTKEQSTDLKKLKTSKQKTEHPRIIFGNENNNTIKKQSVLERLGKRSNLNDNSIIAQKTSKISLTNIRKEEEELLGMLQMNNSYCKTKETDNSTDRSIKPKHGDTPRESALKRLGVMSKVLALPQRNISEFKEEEIIAKEVPSAIKIKPRIMLPPNTQANKNLLLKAVAEAQRSIAQTPIVGSSNMKPDALYTKKYREKVIQIGISNKEKDKIKNAIITPEKREKQILDFSSDDDNLEYVPKPLKKQIDSVKELEYIPSSKDNYDNFTTDDSRNTKFFPRESKSQTFIITLDGISRQQQEQHKSVLHKHTSDNLEKKSKTEHELKKKKLPSPIVFDNVNIRASTKTKQLSNDTLPRIIAQSSIKTKERCKYWPNCRQMDKCEFVHPNMLCKMFPQCKFGDKCLYIHPTCKFETSCTRKDCLYSHSPKKFSNASVSLPQQTCKYYPNCSNSNCTFYHPKPCKYGKYCKNQNDCNFLHGFITKNNFTWHSTVKL